MENETSNPTDAKGEEIRKKYRRPKRYIKKVDFQRIEEAPLNQFEREIQKKIAVVPSALDMLIRGEEEELVSTLLKTISLSRRERECIDRTLAGFTAPEIADELGIQTPSVHLHLRRAVEKIRSRLRKRGKLSE